HDGAVKNAFDHAKLHVMGRIVEQAECRLGRSLKEGAASVPPEILWDDDRGDRLTLVHGLTRSDRRGWPYLEIFLGCKLLHERMRDFAFILVYDQHGNFACFHASFTPPEEVAKEGTANDRNQKSHEHGFPVREKQLQIFSHESEERNHQSRRLL